MEGKGGRGLGRETQCFYSVSGGGIRGRGRVVVRDASSSARRPGASEGDGGAEAKSRASPQSSQSAATSCPPRQREGSSRRQAPGRTRPRMGTKPPARRLCRASSGPVRGGVGGGESSGLELPGESSRRVWDGPASSRSRDLVSGERRRVCLDRGITHGSARPARGCDATIKQSAGMVRRRKRLCTEPEAVGATRRREVRVEQHTFCPAGPVQRLTGPWEGVLAKNSK